MSPFFALFDVRNSCLIALPPGYANVRELQSQLDAIVSSKNKPKNSPSTAMLGREVEVKKSISFLTT
jgi:hypothetical protein